MGTDRNSASAAVVRANFGLHSGLAKCESCRFGHFRLRRKPKIWPSVGLYCEFEIFRRKISGNFSNLSGNFQKFVNYLCQSAVSKSSTVKWCCKISMFSTNNSPDLYTVTLCIMFRKNNLFLARLSGISANLQENYGRYNFRVSLLFPEILNFPKIYGPILFSQLAFAWSNCNNIVLYW